MQSATDRVDRMRRALELARAALDRPDSEREQWLAAQCSVDTSLRDEALALLALDRVPAPGLEPVLSALDDGVANDPLIGTCIGRFRIVERLGSGGMGTVYRAEPVAGVTRQPVALKLIKRGLDSEEILARFMRERGILARLDHPHIARLLDGGLADDGRPWFAMELVDGQPLLAWCDARQLGLDVRLALLLDACEALAYAHRNLVVHRDIKPANVLVTQDGTLKLLDFGIAKLLDAADDGATHGAAPLFTPEYAAPEQVARGSVTTQTDVFQLGVLLHELVAGVRPQWPGHCAQAVAQLRQWQARDPQVFEAMAQLRGSSGKALLRSLQGDLGRILCRALQEEPGRRYASVAALAEDLRHLRRGEPVSATADRWTYRTRMFLRRHRVAVAATSAVLGALALGTGLALHEAWQRSQAEQASQSALAMLEEVFLSADPYAAKGGDTRALDLVERAEVAAKANANPVLAARLLTEIGNVHVSLGDRAKAEEALRAALAAGERAGAAATPWTEGARARLAHYSLVDDGDAAGAAMLDLAITRLRAAGADGQAQLAQALEFKADAAFNRGDYASIASLSAEATRLHRLTDGETSPRYAVALGNQASLLRAIGRPADALEPARKAWAILQELAEIAPPSTLCYVEQQYAGALVDNQRVAEAEPLLHEALQRASSTPGTDQLLIDGISWELANVQLSLGRFDEAARGLRALAGRADRKSANLAAIDNALGNAESARGDAAAALAAFEQALHLLCADDAATPPCLVIGLNRAEALLAHGDRADARAALDRLDARIGADATAVRGRWRAIQAQAHLTAGDAEGAARMLAPRLEQARAATQDDAADARLLALAARIETARGQDAQALVDLREAERRMGRLWQGTPLPLAQVRAHIAQLQARSAAAHTR